MLSGSVMVIFNNSKLFEGPVSSLFKSSLWSSLVFHLLSCPLFFILSLLSSSVLSLLLWSLLSSSVLSLLLWSLLSSSVLSLLLWSCLSFSVSVCLSLFLSLCLCLRVVVCGVCVVSCGLCAVCCACWCGCCCCVWCVVVFGCVVWHAEKTSVCRFKTSPCVPAPRLACVKTCGRGVGTHGDVLNLHTEVFWTDTRGGGGERGKGGVTVSSAYQDWST